MKLWNKPQPDTPTHDDDPRKHLSHLGQNRVSAAAHLDTALIEVEASIEGLLEADRAFFEYANVTGQNHHGSGGHLRRILRTLIVGQMQNSTPQFIKQLGIPYLPARVRGAIADAVARTNSKDLDHVLPAKETAQ